MTYEKHYKGKPVNEIAHLLGLPEGRTLEFKRDLSSLRPVLRTLVAFANTAGGTLIVGRDDDGRLRGVTSIQDEEERLVNAIHSYERHRSMSPEVNGLQEVMQWYLDWI